MSELNLKCPKCQSENSQKLSILFKQGISDVSLSTTGGGLGYGGKTGLFSIGMSGNSSGISQTALSKYTAPPRKRKYFNLLNLNSIVGVFLTLLLWVFAIIFLAAFFEKITSFLPRSVSHDLSGIASLAVMGFMLYYFVYKYNKNIYPELYKRWDDAYLCTRCENVFIPINNP